MSEFPPIAEYAFLSDCENSCLIAPDGSVEWLCLPRPDSSSVFGALLDRSAGSFRFGPGEHHGSSPAPLRARHDGARDDLAHSNGMAGRPRSHGYPQSERWDAAPRLSAGAHGLGGIRGPAPDGEVHLRQGRGRRQTAFRCSTMASPPGSGPTTVTAMRPPASTRRMAMSRSPW